MASITSIHSRKSNSTSPLRRIGVRMLPRSAGEIQMQTQYTNTNTNKDENNNKNIDTNSNTI